jgi:nicotinate-nucleotide adenylyltransferase
MNERYILVQWPESQALMDHPRFNECVLGMDIDGHDEVGGSAYFVPESLYKELFRTPGKKRVGLFMGSFDPPHKGHLEVAKKAIRDGLVDEVLIVPTPGNPWKASPNVEIRRKVAYCMDAFKEGNFRVVSGLYQGEDIKGLQDRDGKYYAYKQILKVILVEEDNNPMEDTEYVILCGTDVYESMKDWKHGEWIIKNFPPVLIGRPGYSDDADSSLPEISSTEIRNLIKKGDWKSVEPYLSPDLLKTLREDGIYG